MKKRSRSILSIVCVLAMMLALFAGCNGDGNGAGSSKAESQSQASKAESENAGTDSGGKREKLVINATMEANTGAKDSIVEQAFQKLMSEKLGREVEINYTLISGANSAYEEQAKLLLASNDITDFFQLPFLYDYAKQASEGMFVNLLDYRDQLPQYFAYLEQTDGGLANAMDGEGNVFVLAGIGLPRFPQDSGMLPENVTTYRYDIFEENNIPIPTTLDELYEAAKQLKEIYPNTYPINTRWRDLRTLFAANHTDGQIYWNGEEYVMGVLDEGYQEAVAFANKLYAEGLLDPEYIIDTDDTLKSKQLSDKTFIVLADWFSTPGEFTRLSGEEQIFSAALFPDNPKYGKAWQNVQRVNQISTNIFSNYVISSQTEDLEGLLEFINHCYDEDVIRLITWGIEGETYTLGSDGKPMFTEQILTAEDPWIKADEWGMRASQNGRPGLGLIDDSTAFVALSPLDWLYYEGELHVEPFEQSEYYLSFPYPDNELIKPQFFEPKLQFTTEEAQERSQMQTAFDTYRDEMQAKFVSGEESMDNWDSFIAGFDEIMDVDRFVQIHNDAAKRYLDNADR